MILLKFQGKHVQQENLNYLNISRLEMCYSLDRIVCMLHRWLIIHNIWGGQGRDRGVIGWTLEQSLSFDSRWSCPPILNTEPLNQLSSLHPFATCRHY